MNERNLAIGGVLALGIAVAVTGSDDATITTTAETNSQQTLTEPSAGAVEEMLGDDSGPSTSEIEQQRNELIGSTRQLPNDGKVRILDAEYRPERSDVSPWRVKVETISEVDASVDDRWTRDTGDVYWTQVMSQ